MDGMEAALEEARKAMAEGEVPVGAALLRGEKILWADHNRREQRQDPTAHAEMLCLREGAGQLGSWRLEECTLYVTLEPCPMCAGAIVQARIPRVVMGAMNPKAGCAGSVTNLLQMQGFNHRVEIRSGILEEDSRELLQSFFRELRERDRRIKASGQ